MADPEILFERRGHAGVITLNRPKALNALTLNMVRLMHPQLEAWAGDDRIHHVVVTAAGDKAFCAGGDIRQLYEWGRAKDPTFLDFYREEYLLNTLIKRYPKPYVAIMDGITMGGGVGISVHGSHRVATERLTFAMPETGIGLFPDVGGSYFLPRCPGRIGLYLGLTGHRLTAADAAYAGIATHFAESIVGDGLVDELCSSSDVDACLRTYANSPGSAGLEENRALIDHHFSAASVQAIIDSLNGGSDPWCTKTVAVLAQKSPTSLQIAMHQLTLGADLSFEDCMRMEFRIVNRVFSGHDFFEGTRAIIIDKDQAPDWQPGTLAEVDPAAIEGYFDMVANELPV